MLVSICQTRHFTKSNKRFVVTWTNLRLPVKWLKLTLTNTCTEETDADNQALGSNGWFGKLNVA